VCLDRIFDLATLDESYLLFGSSGPLPSGAAQLPIPLLEHSLSNRIRIFHCWSTTDHSTGWASRMAPGLLPAHGAALTTNIRIWGRGTFARIQTDSFHRVVALGFLLFFIVHIVTPLCGGAPC
jgi:hypothetical protein